MNLILQREKLKAIHKSGIIDLKMLTESLNAPVFVWDLGDRDHFTPEQEGFINSHICTEATICPTISPFKCFRISSKTGFMVWWMRDNCWELIEIKYACADSHSREILLHCQYAREAGGKCIYACWMDGENFSDKFNDKNGNITSEGSRVFRSMLSWLIMFLYDIEVPGNVVLKQSPSKSKCGGKSVEWRLAREHYLIVGKKEAVQCREGQCAPTEAQIARGAHYRKSYYRLLRSPVFRHKQGQKVRVKDTWVGPEEWIGLDGKCYKVILNLKQPD